MSTVQVAVVSTRQTLAAARTTVRTVAGTLPGATVTVLDADGSYIQVGTESVLSLDDLGLRPSDVRRQAAGLTRRDLVARLQPALVRSIQAAAPDPGGTTVLALAAGVLLLRPPTEVLEAATRHGLCLLARTPEPLSDDHLWPGLDDLTTAGAISSEMIAVHGAQPHPGVLDRHRPVSAVGVLQEERRVVQRLERPELDGHPPQRETGATGAAAYQTGWSGTLTTESGRCTCSARRSGHRGVATPVEQEEK